HIIEENYLSEDFRRILGINFFNDVPWFNKEGFDDALYYSSLFFMMDGSVDLPIEERIERISAIYDVLTKAEEKSEYRFDVLIDSLTAKTKSKGQKAAATKTTTAKKAAPAKEATAEKKAAPKKATATKATTVKKAALEKKASTAKKATAEKKAAPKKAAPAKKATAAKSTAKKSEAKKKAPVKKTATKKKK
ncbi:MAG: hypothetical protein FWC01_06480, partial [Treponema sp.]|nr:hypothetical protein [Treponema sp.]MCL2237473.1 hypothetical protein [Treponema sp.]